MNLRTQSLGSALGPLRYLGSCVACGWQFASANTPVVVMRGIHCTSCAREAVAKLPEYRKQLRDLHADPPPSRDLYVTQQIELENRIAELVGATANGQVM